MTQQPKLSAIVVVGVMRERGQRAVDALFAQTVGDAMEIIVVDMCSATHPPLQMQRHMPFKYVEASDAKTFVRARIAGVAVADSEVVAFIEDHAFAEPGWAEALIDAHRSGWSVVAFAMRNENPATYVSRASMVIDYGPWRDPVKAGPTYAVPAHNASYKRAVLREFWDELEELLAPDQVLHERLRQRGEKFYLEGGAIARHENFSRWSRLLRSNFAYGRLYAAQRVRSHRLGRTRRLVHGALAVTVAPWRRFVLLARDVAPRSMSLDLVKALPLLAPAYFVGGLGVGLGYVAGSGSAEETLTHLDFEVDKNR